MMTAVAKQPAEHERRILGLFEGRTRFEGRGPVLDRPLVLIGFVQRCGSHLLAAHLASTGRFSRIGEFLNAPFVQRAAERQALRSFPDYMRHLHDREPLAPGKALCVKASADQIEMLLRWNVPAMFAGLEVIHLRRLDVVAQAVSMVITSWTGQWTASHEAVAPPPDYDFEEIDRRLAALHAGNDRIETLCALAGVERIVATYEDLVADPGSTVRRICAPLGIDLAGWEPSEPGVRRQADPLKTLYRARFVDEARARLGLPASEVADEAAGPESGFDAH